MISAVEGVQPQTRILMRALARLAVPALLFVNKIDRRGADCEGVLRVIAERLTPAIVPMGAVRGAGTRAAAFTPWSGADDGFRARLAEALAERDERDEEMLAAYLRGLEPGAPRLEYRRLRSAIERGPAGEKIAYVRMFAGTPRTRDQVRFGGRGGRNVTAIEVLGGGPAVRRESVSAGEIGKLTGLAEVQVGDLIGGVASEPGAGAAAAGTR